VLNEARPATANRIPEILQQLRAATKGFHNDAELALALPGSIATREAYVRLLGVLWSFYEPLEARLDSVAGLAAALPDWPARHKAHLLAADLNALGAEIPPADAATNAALAHLATLRDALGALYVVEGATLGGAVVGPLINTALPDANGAFAFYRCYGAQIGPRWREFILALSRESGADAEAGAEIVSAACLTFETFLAHVSRAGGSPRAQESRPS
jgi:heme oxygenase